MAISISMDNIHRYTLLTLVDITQTGVTYAVGDSQHQRNQQRNWESLLQSISLIAQPMMIDGPDVVLDDVSMYNFGEMFQGEHKIWIANFAVEHSEVFANNESNTGKLEDTMNLVPVVTGLDETAKFMLPIFYSAGALKNIYFIQGTF